MSNRAIERARRRGVTAGIFLLGVLHRTEVPAQVPGRAAYFDEPSAVRVVGTPRPGEALPVLIVLPPTGGTAADVDQVLEAFIVTPHLVILPHGAPSRAEYERDFDAFAGWFDARITVDLAEVRAHYPIDEQRVLLAGFSLGGDLAWALLARHADRFRGAFVMGSRCGTTMTTSALATLRARGGRVVFAIGRRDADHRVAGLRRAARAVAAARVASREFEFDGEHQLPTETSLFDEAFRMLFAP